MTIRNLVQEISLKIGGKPTDDDGKCLRERAIEASLNTEEIESDMEERRLFINYSVVLMLLDLTLDISNGREWFFRDIFERQKNYIEKSSGGSGELLLKISSLLDIEPDKVLRPFKSEDGGEDKFKKFMHSQAMKAMQLDLLPTFIAKTLDEIQSSSEERKKEWERNIRARLELLGIILPQTFADRVALIKQRIAEQIEDSSQ